MQDRVLLAVSPEVERRLTAALTGFRVTLAADPGALRRALAAQQFDLVAVGAHFDESKALATIQEIRAAASHTPVVCIQGVPFQRVGRPAIEAFRLACEALGVPLVIDLRDYADDEAGNRALSALFEKLSSRQAA